MYKDIDQLNQNAGLYDQGRNTYSMSQNQAEMENRQQVPIPNSNDFSQSNVK